MSENPAIETGMRVQLQEWHRRLQQGEKRLGWKVGLNDPEVQRAMGINAPLVGFMTSRTLIEAGGVYRIGAGVQAMVEVEVCAEIAVDVAPGTSPEQASAAIATLAPALEIVDFARPKGSVDTILGHDIFHEAVVIGAPVSPALRFAPERLEPQLIQNGAAARSVEPAYLPASYGHMIAVVAARLGDAGERLRRGDRVICGSFVKPLPVSAGDQVKADFGLMGSIGVVFA